MGDAAEKIPVNPSISSKEHEELLNIIDTIRSQGISRYIDIPQIVVCGDQSSGKSSTLEAVCGLRFPTSDGLCTRFATEYILRRGGDNAINISIVPDHERPDNEKATLQSFKPSRLDLEDFTTISKEAADAMGIDHNGKTFSHDVLRIEICGPTQPHLTLVDLPGLFHAGIDKKGDDNVEAVEALVRSYIEKPRSIILAVVSGRNDLNLQKVIKFIRDYDPDGSRTLGVITKPDTIPADSPTEAQYLKVAQNSEVPYTLGWHVVKNRSFEQRDCSTQIRDIDEARWLSRGVWNALSPTQKGIGALRVRLSAVLQNHILAELPSLLKDVDAGVDECQSRLQILGSSRRTLADQRLYLLRASETFARLTSASIDGNYTDAFFGSSANDQGYEKRLRAVAVNVMKDFAQDMRRKGHAVQLVDKPYTSEKSHWLDSDETSTPTGTPKHVTKDAFYEKVQFRMSRNSGRELPGLFNPGIIGDLFFDHSEPWRRIMASARDHLIEAAHTTIGHILEHSTDEATIGGILREIVNPGMEPLERDLSAKVEEILKPHLKGHPQTYNHYFTDNVQEKRREEDRKDLTKRLETYFGRNPESDEARERSWQGILDVKVLLDALVRPKEVNMDRFAAIEAVNAMLGYYKVALKNVVDAFTMYAIEECLLNRMTSIFTPESVYTLDETTITRIAGESEQSIVERESLTKKLAILKETQRLLRRMDRHRPIGMSTRIPWDENGDNESSSNLDESTFDGGVESNDDGNEEEEEEEEEDDERDDEEEEEKEEKEEEGEEDSSGSESTGEGVKEEAKGGQDWDDIGDPLTEQRWKAVWNCLRHLRTISLKTKALPFLENTINSLISLLDYLTRLPPRRRRRLNHFLSSVSYNIINMTEDDSAFEKLNNGVGSWDAFNKLRLQMPWTGSTNPSTDAWLTWRADVVAFAYKLARKIEKKIKSAARDEERL